ncbi:feruloyl-CoA synthase [Pseudonocardia sulfidoxydans NBRC 16205]|uniref:Feruloyl-CoA synthase n=1 Tax=Pseudonocardia sulfidoxydans NBRC 16205 TaxID=1223511 RepID=A0A511D9L1_9PSEU|nr:feruloyl-CoA synthase [Pseudonocardia sulfidoxydans]GEL21287.1 feruloyl-CoA synthase [Pseudonocardia sulfidoxydans NBRC 16205]
MTAHDDTAATSPATFARPRIVAKTRPDGSVLLRSTDGLGPHSDHVGQELHRWADAAPDRLLITEPTPQGRRDVTYGRARTAAQGLAQALLDLGAAPDRPLLVLAGNSPEHLQLTLACYLAGVPVVPASIAYSLSSADHRQLRTIAALVRPAAVFVDDVTAFAGAIDAVVDAVRAAGVSAPTVLTRGAATPRGGAPVVTFDELAATRPGEAAARAYEAVTPDTVAKIIFTSGSTGSPKGVLTTHRMLTSNQQMMRQVWPFLQTEPPVLVDWLPWSHTFGGSHNVGLVLSNGGTLHIDAGRPTPALFDRTLAALAEIAPTIYVNVPAGYTLLVPRLEADPGFARHFFSRLRLLFYAAAALPQALWDRLEALVDEHADHPIPLTASWGTTETAPAATSAHWSGSRCGCIGVPLPGVRLKLVPVDGKKEIRIAGPSITPGYHDRPDATAAAFDDEGFYRTGDAVVLVDADDPDQGLMFDGRIAEDFKLTTGTWVHVATVRGTLLSAARVLTDAVLAGHDRDEVTALAWLNVDEARTVCGLAPGADVPLDHPDLRRHLASALAEVGAAAGSAGRVARLLLCDEPPDLDAGEITDKGYINQRAVLDRRSDLVELLYAPHVDPRVIESASVAAAP